MREKKIIIWDERPRHPFVGINALWITSPEELYDFPDFDNVDSIFLPEHLSWNIENAPTDYEGINILVYLRYQQVLAPIILCSTTPKAHLLSNGLVNFGFLKLKYAHPVIPMPAVINDHPVLANISPLSQMQLQDAINHFGNPAGVVEEQLHYLKNNFDTALVAIPKIFTLIKGVIAQVQHSALDEIELECLNNYIKGNYSDYIKLLGDVKSKILQLLPQTVRPIKKGESAATWRALYIDDQEEHGQNLRHELRQRGINCLLAKTGEEAIKILEKDFDRANRENKRASSWPQNSIGVVICDLRFEDKNGDWQKMQGYDIIDFIHKRLNNFVSFVVLSAKNGDIEELQDSLGYVKWRGFRKENILSAGENKGFSLLADHIQQEGEEMANLLNSFPSAKVWSKAWEGKINAPLKTFYRAFRLSAEYMPKEVWIGNCAMSYIEEAKQVKDPFFRKKNKIGSLPFSIKFKAGIPDGYPSVNSMDKFYTKLIGRRIAIGLFAKGWGVRDISNIMRYQELNDESIDRQLFSAYLALSTDLEKIIPNQLLIEERSWLQRRVGFSMLPDDRRFFSAFQQILEDLQEQLYQANCPDDFVELNLLIGDKAKAINVFLKAQELCIKFNLSNEFNTIFKKFFDSDRYRKAAKRNGLLTISSSI